MNAREGRVGRQEAAALGALSCIAMGVFAREAHGAQQGGTGRYLSCAFGAAVALLIFVAIAGGMREKRVPDLAALYTRAFGRIGGAVAGLVTALLLAVAAAEPLAGIFAILDSCIYTEAPVQNVLFYALVPLLFFALMGLETLTRTAKLFTVVILLAMAVFAAMAAPAFETFRLYPLLSEGLRETLSAGLSESGRFLPALLALLICANGLHGVKNASFAGYASILVGGTVAVGVLLCVGLTFDQGMLATVDAPVYRAMMTARTGSAYVRADKLLLFFWTIAALLCAGFFAYAAALTHMRAFGMRDVRPAAAAYVELVAGLALAVRLESGAAVKLIDTAERYGFLPLALLPLIAALTASLRREECA